MFHPGPRRNFVGAMRSLSLNKHTKTVNSWMLLELFIVFVLLQSNHVVEAVPFRFRGGDDSHKNNNDDDALADTASEETTTSSSSATAAYIQQDEVDELRVVPTKSYKPRRNEIVERFFQTTTSTVLSNSNVSALLKDEIYDRAHEMKDFLVSTRRTLHRHPELMYQEQETAAVVERILSDLDISYTTGWAVNTHPYQIPGKGGYGIVADIGTGDQPCVLLRADMDALPILERTLGVDSFKSQDDGKMHACGHDGHTTMLLGAAKLLKSMEDSINGTVRLMFQPAEEGGAGAKRMREEGVLDKEPRPRYAFGMHVWPTLPSGVVAARPGPVMAAAEMFEIVVAGVGGHAAMPHLTIDPIVAASAIVMSLQTIVSRNLSPLEAGVCSVTKFEAGEAFNIIPASAVLRGTVRALSTEALLSLRNKVQHIAETTAKVHGCNITIQYSPDFYPPTVNDPDLFESFSKEVGSMVSRDGKLKEVQPTMGGEDFSFIAEAIPSTFFFLGQGSGSEPPTNYGLHHPHFALDESVMPQGVELHVNLALRALHRLSSSSSSSPRAGTTKNQQDTTTTVDKKKKKVNKENLFAVKG